MNRDVTAVTNSGFPNRSATCDDAAAVVWFWLLLEWVPCVLWELLLWVLLLLLLWVLWVLLLSEVKFVSLNKALATMSTGR